MMLMVINQTAAAHGRTPRWIRGINATELWALLMGTQTSDAVSTLHVDCLSVQKGSQQGSEWATSSARKYARAWAPVASNLEEDVHRVVWMPAHCTASHDGVRSLSTGQPLTEAHRLGNAAVDELAKGAARQDAPPGWQLQAVSKATNRLLAVAKWIGQIGAFANRFPLPEHLRTEKCRYGRDAEGVKQPPRKTQCGAKLSRQQSRSATRLCKTPRLAALRDRVVAKTQAAAVQEALVSEPSAKVPRLWPAGRPVQAISVFRKKRRRRQQPRAEVGGADGHFEALPCSSHAPVHATLASGTAGRTRQEWPEGEAEGDLRELERDGLRVAWPSEPCATSRPALPAPRPGRAKMASPEPSPEVAAALKELEELRACGLAVRLPR